MKCQLMKALDNIYYTGMFLYKTFIILTILDIFLRFHVILFLNFSVWRQNILKIESKQNILEVYFVRLTIKENYTLVEKYCNHDKILSFIISLFYIFLIIFYYFLEFLKQSLNLNVSIFLKRTVTLCYTKHVYLYFIVHIGYMFVLKYWRKWICTHIQECFLYFDLL